MVAIIRAINNINGKIVRGKEYEVGSRGIVFRDDIKDSLKLPITCRIFSIAEGDDGNSFTRVRVSEDCQVVIGTIKEMRTGFAAEVGLRGMDHVIVRRDNDSIMVPSSNNSQLEEGRNLVYGVLITRRKKRAK